jgi:hypothetical protein
MPFLGPQSLFASFIQPPFVGKVTEYALPPPCSQTGVSRLDYLMMMEKDSLGHVVVQSSVCLFIKMLELRGFGKLG